MMYPLPSLSGYPFFKRPASAREWQALKMRPTQFGDRKNMHHLTMEELHEADLNAIRPNKLPSQVEIRGDTTS